MNSFMWNNQTYYYRIITLPSQTKADDKTSLHNKTLENINMPTDIKPQNARKTWLIQSLHSTAVKLLALKGTIVVIFLTYFVGFVYFLEDG